MHADLLARIRAFYQAESGREAAAHIVGLTLEYIYVRRRYKASIHLDTRDKRPFIGRGGEIVNRLRSQLNVDINL